MKEGLQTPLAGELVIESVAPAMPQIYSESEAASLPAVTSLSQKKADGADRKTSAEKLREVERQQEEFGEKPK